MDAATRTLLQGRCYKDYATRTKLQHATSKTQLEASSSFHILHLPLSLSPNFSSSHFSPLCFVQNLARQGRIHGHKWLSLRRQKSKSKTKASHTDGRTDTTSYRVASSPLKIFYFRLTLALSISWLQPQGTTLEETPPHPREIVLFWNLEYQFLSTERDLSQALSCQKTCLYTFCECK